MNAELIIIDITIQKVIELINEELKITKDVNVEVLNKIKNTIKKEFDFID